MKPGISIEDDIKGTLDRSKKIRDEGISDGKYGPVTSEHFHSYEYLVGLIAERQEASNRKLDRLTVFIAILTAIMAITSIKGCCGIQSKPDGHNEGNHDQGSVGDGQNIP